MTFKEVKEKWAELVKAQTEVQPMTGDFFLRISEYRDVQPDDWIEEQFKESEIRYKALPNWVKRDP